MKNYIKSFALIAITALALAGCAKEIENVASKNGIHSAQVVLSKSDLQPQPQNKTAIVVGQNTASFKWIEGDIARLHVYENTEEGTITDMALSQNDEVATLTVTFENHAPNDAGDKYVYRAIYGSLSNSGDPLIPAEQHPVVETVLGETNYNFDPNADILISKEIKSETTLGELDFTMGRVVTVNRMTLTGLISGEKLLSVDFELEDQYPASVFQGRDAEGASIFDGSSKKLTLLYNKVTIENGTFPVYFISAPVTNATIKEVVVTTDKTVYAKNSTIDPSLAGKSLSLQVARFTGFSMALPAGARESVGDPYTWALASGDLGSNGSPDATLSDKGSPELDWTASYTFADNTKFLGWDGNGRGVQFGSGSHACNSATFTTDGYSDYIHNVSVNAAATGTGSLSVTVGGEALYCNSNTSISLTNAATDYLFEAQKLIKGDVVISYSSGNKAFYIKSVEINPDLRADPELSYSPNAYSVVAGGTLDTPELSYATGFDGTVTYAIGDGDDADVASVNASTGAVTVGTKTGSVTVTASFAGNETYKPGSTSYTITVGAADLSVSTNAPDAAECTAGAMVSFTVTSNVEWSATTDDESIITSIDPSAAQSPSANPVTVTVTLAANAGAQRTATVKVRPTNQTAYSSLNKNVTVTQNAYAATLYYEKVMSAPSDWTGDYLIICEGENKALSSISTTSTKYGIGADVTITENKIEATNTTNAYKVVIAQATNSGTGYTFSLVSANAFLNWSSGNSLASNANETDNSRWTITAGATSGNWIIANVADNNRIIWYNTGSPRFACYTGKSEEDSGYAAIQLYKLEETPDTREYAPISYAPDNGTATMSASGINYSLPVLSNAQSLELTYASSSEAVATVNANGVVTAVAEGETTISATYDGSDSNAPYKTTTVHYTLTVTDNRTACATPSFSPAAGAVAANSTVTISCETEGATIHYTIDGSEPTTASTTYSSAITINAAKTIKAIAVKPNYKNSEIATAAYTIAINTSTEQNPYTASQAIALATEHSSETIADVYVKGIVCQTGSISSGAVNYYVSDDGTTTNKFEMYKGKYISGADFTEGTNMRMGDLVVAKGTLKYFSNNNQAELDANNEVISVLRAPSFSPVAGVYSAAQSVEISADNGATVYYTTDGSEPTTSSATYSAAIAVNSDMTIKAFVVKDGIATGIVTATYTINANANDGTQAKPFTADEAYDLIIAGNTSTYYVSGTVVSVGDLSSGSLTYYISEDGTSTNQIQVYKGKYLGNTSFTSASQLSLGDNVIVQGALLYYNNTKPEINSGNVLYSINGKTKALTLDTFTITTDNSNNKKDITVTWGASGTTSTISYVITCAKKSDGSGSQSYNASAAGSHTFSVNSYGTDYTITVTASADDAISATNSEDASVADPNGNSKTYTVTFPDDNSSTNGVSAYTSTWTAAAGSFSITITNFNNNSWGNEWTYIKCGRKNTASTATITTSSAIPEAIRTVKITIDALTASKITSITLYSSSDESTWSSEGTFDKSTGEKSVTIASPTANKYYKLEFVCASGSSNGLLTLSKVVYTTN